MEFTKPSALNASLVESESDTEETKDRGSESSSSAAPAEPAQHPPPQQSKPQLKFKSEGQFSFYYKQLEKIHNSGIDIKNQAPEDIIKQLVQKADSLRRDTQMDIRDKLKMIKVDQQIMPTLLASEINEQINNQKEIKSNNDLKRFLYSKQNAQNKILV